MTSDRLWEGQPPERNRAAVGKQVVTGSPPDCQPEQDADLYRVGRKLGRTIYRGDDLIGIMDRVSDAQMIVAALNEARSTPPDPAEQPIPSAHYSAARVPDTREGWKGQAEYLARKYNALADRWAKLYNGLEAVRDELEKRVEERRMGTGNHDAGAWNAYSEAASLIQQLLGGEE